MSKTKDFAEFLSQKLERDPELKRNVELERAKAQAAGLLGKIPTRSTRHMELNERMDGIATMLDDLHLLAERDGCIAAAWALEFFTEVYGSA